MCNYDIFVAKTRNYDILSRKFMITRSSIAFVDFLGSSIAPQVMPPWCWVSSDLTWYGRWVRNELVLRWCLLQNDLLSVSLGHSLQQLGLLDGGQVSWGSCCLQLRFLNFRFAFPERRMCLTGRSWDDKLPDDHNLMLIVSMVRVSRVEKVKLGVVDLILEKNWH